MTSGLDSALLIALTVVAVTVGKPLSYLSCPTLGAGVGGSFSAEAATNSDVVNAASSIMRSSVGFLVGDASPLGAQTACFELKAVWGLAVALCVLFAFSAIVCACLWKRIKSAAARPAPKDLEG